ncbi:MAG: aminotransferase class III-fold pyridoxal phosphate-dependent enzyme [Treponemataceae bacterium]|nr:aminotransferase class III-fold pyridoxal phosphate-dependent enzyme [Treponemataceae bacterium]
MAGVIANNFGSLPVVFEKGQGCVLTDVDGKNYIDFVSGIGVNCLGHNHPELVKAIQEQASKQIHISNYYNSDKGLAFSELLLAKTGYSRVFFGNSGAEANEAAIKLARKYGWLVTTGQIADTAGRKVPENSGASASDNGASCTSGPACCAASTKARNVIVTLEKSFHGRTVATLSATGQDRFHPDCFAPYPAGFRTIKANDYEVLATAFDDSVCAFMLECVQGEGGVNLIEPEWAVAACDAARKAGAIVIADEVQTGMGRTGTLLACEQLGFKPEAVTLAKGIAGGIPMGACLYGGILSDVFVPGDHQSTFGGNPIACAAGLAVLKTLTSSGFLQAVAEKGDYIRKTVRGWNLPCVKDVRGRGLMIGIDVTQVSGEVQKACLAAAPTGLCISTAGPNTLRFLPPLVITKEEMDTGLEVLKGILQE